MDFFDIFYGNLLTISFLITAYVTYRFMQYLYRQICWLYGCYQDYKRLCMIKNICCSIVDFMPTLIFTIFYGYIVNRCINTYNNKSIILYLLEYFMGVGTKQPTSTSMPTSMPVSTYGINFNELMKSLGPLNCVNPYTSCIGGNVGATGPSGKTSSKTSGKTSGKSSGVIGVTGVTGATGATGPSVTSGSIGVIGVTGSNGSPMSGSPMNGSPMSGSPTKPTDYAPSLQSIMSPLNMFIDSLQNATNPTGIGSINGINGINGLSSKSYIPNSISNIPESNTDTSL
ncbi:MAG: hypothetical protein Homavirus1_13 [Homavirus sp.]|uniref:Uncharacterized protein n=1 Tax=Homavirus sp. TaxID=2487769 RepID=A0A3G5A828_9VIRU|nr:MAG: hypothetical protein Homavirus1_13 [Homavirus sp.]